MSEQFSWMCIWYSLREEKEQMIYYYVTFCKFSKNLTISYLKNTVCKTAVSEIVCIVDVENTYKNQHKMKWPYSMHRFTLRDLYVFQHLKLCLVFQKQRGQISR